jgi:hypothetical protein
LSQADRYAIEAGGDISVRARLKPDVSAQPGGNGRWHNSRFLFSGSAQSRDIPLAMGKERSEFALRQ